MTIKSDFSLYSMGYIDGYHGNPRVYLSNNWYAQGYEEGRQDDLEGQPCKYTHSCTSNESLNIVVPIRPDQSGAS